MEGPCCRTHSQARVGSELKESMAITTSFAASLGSVVMAPAVSAPTFFAQVDACTSEEVERAFAAG